MILKENLFKPRNLESRYDVWNKEQPIIDGVQINQYNKDGQRTGRWGEGEEDGGNTLDLFNIFWGIFGLEDESLINNHDSLRKYAFEPIITMIESDLTDVLSEDGPLSEAHFDMTIPLRGEEVWDNFLKLYGDGFLTESNKLFNLAENKGLFKPRNLSGENNRYLIWNKQQPIIDGVQINQYNKDGQRTGRWGEGEFYGGDTLDLLETYWGVFEDTIDYLEDEEDIFDELLNIINTSLEDSLSEYGPLSENWYNLTIPLTDNRIWEKFKEIKKIDSITESKNLFKPRNLDRWVKWNSEQPEKYGVKINQYDLDGNKTGYWENFRKPGNFISRGLYKSNIQVGYWEFFYSNNKVSDRGLFDNDGERNGIWWEYEYSDGKCYFKGLFDNGALVHRFPIRSIDHKIPNTENLFKGMSKNDKKKFMLDENLFNLVENKGLFKPRNLSGESNRFLKWNSEQPEKEVNGGLIKINQYDSEGNKQGYWEENDIIEDEYNEDLVGLKVFGAGQYKDGKPIGAWNWFYEDGGEYVIQNFDNNGERHGEYFVYDEYGDEICYSEYYHGKENYTNSLNEDVNKKILKSFVPKKELNPKIWGVDDVLKDDVRETLLSIADKFYETLEIDIPVEDIVMTGSLANYNWSEYSDIDLHIHIDFAELKDKEISKKYFDAKKYIWNNDHNITIKGYEVELYVQDINENHESTGVYSVMNNEWVDKPEPMNVKIDKGTIKTKVNQFNSDFSFIQDDFNNENYESAEKELTKLKEKIKKYRQAGLDTGGEMSTENLVFKVLRRSKFIEKLYNLGLKIVDKEFTLKEGLFKPRNIMDRREKWNSEQPEVDGIKINQYDENGLKQGKWEEKEEGENGELVYGVGIYRNDISIGEWIWKYESGVNYSIMNFDNNGEMNGWQTSFDTNGDVRTKNKYCYGVRVNNVFEESIKEKVNPITDYIKQFKTNFSLDVSFLLTFGSAINGIISNLTTLINESSLHSLTTYEKINLAIAIFSIYLKNKNSLLNFKNELLTITAFATLIPTYSNIINGLVGNIDFMESLKNMGKGLSIYGVLTSLKKK